MTQTEASISLTDISFRYNESHDQLRALTLTVQPGEMVLVTGPSGSGKTTLTRLLNGLIPHFYDGELTGTLRLAGSDANQLTSWQYGELVGSVFQDSKTQFFSSIVRDELAFTGENYGLEPAIIQRRLKKLAKAADLTKLLDKSVMAISSGEKQKVSLASARVTDPPILVLDEPSANLDLVATADLAAQLKQLKKAGKTVVIAEHRLAYLMPLVDRILYLVDGRFVAQWSPAELLTFSAAKLAELGLRAADLRRVSNQQQRVETRQESNEQPRISVVDLTVGHGGKGEKVLQGLNFQVGKGEIVALTGPNGVGKTTLAQTLSGLLSERAGTILINGRKASAKQRLKKVWFVMQDSDYQLFADSVMQELVMGTKRREGDLQRAEKVLKSLALWEFRDYHPAALSGGQKQRLTFGIAIMQQPEIIILDEPTSGLDGKNLQRVIDLLRELAEKGITILIITHDYELVTGVCQRLLYINQGKLLSDLAITDERLTEVMRIMRDLPS